MVKHGDLTGKRFGRLVVLRRAEDHISPAGHKTDRQLSLFEEDNDETGR